ncbi:MAG: transcription-repair coupling factor [Gammaproteobacteria bacterium]|nr:transcription-repair coupling factor [Gammaproteobacteria bacterium]
MPRHPDPQESSESVLAPPLPAHTGERLCWHRLAGGAATLALACAVRRHKAPVLALCADTLRADRMAAELEFFLDNDPATPVLRFPDWETLPYEQFSPYQDIISERLATLAGLPHARHGVLVAATAPILHRLPPRSFVAAHSFMLELGEHLDRDAFQARLDEAGYRRTGQVLEHGDYAIRGALVDVFPMGAEQPFRIDLFDEEIEGIRLFDAETQRSTEAVAKVRVLPAREFPLTDAAVSRFRSAWRARFPGNPARSTLYTDVSNRFAPAGIEYYLPLFFEQTESLFDFLPADTLVVVDEGVAEQAQRFSAEVAERYERLRHDVERPILPPAELFYEPEWIPRSLARFAVVEITGAGDEGSAAACTFAAETPLAIPIDARARDPLAHVERFLAEADRRVLFVAESGGRRETLLEVFASRGIRPAPVAGWGEFAAGNERIAMAVAPLERGVVLTRPALAVVAETQLYGERAAQRRRRRQSGRDAESVLRDLGELAIGAPVVHEEHGIGRYLGLVILDVRGHPGEFLSLEYADGDKLYVPVASLYLVARYTGPDGDHAPLNKLGTGQWQKAREKAAQRIRDVAAELLDLHARRAARSGHGFALDAESYRAFAAAFAFEETPDQAVAIEAVIADMVAPRPMDRLVCGDAGFGKTEVAMRAAFVAVTGGRQVAVLVPTTLLAQQHFENFKDRFADWPVRIEQLSRFRNNKEQGVILAGLAAGTIDIVIGTHKLLQSDVKFKQLGLLVVDEEHRFGVRQKERLKALRAEVDILNLTATPIPRTLNMALAGIRDLSLIATPPSRRLPVKTFLRRWDDELLREAMLREVNRGGQVYFLHNEVESIERMTATVAAILPEGRVRLAHGQMRERDLERVMLDFYHRRFNVLVCSTIIESGIDVPSANTIIINRADRFGLAQLYQLRGRVGRSHHRAYAYLLVPERRAMTADALKRLEAIESLEDLGIGFTLATHDLEIRGAGEILGEEQSGHIQAIGYGLYMQLLERAVSALRSGREPVLDRPLDAGPEIDLGVAALIPEDYLPDVHARLTFYKRLATAADEQSLRGLAEEMIDRFGSLPVPARNLFRIAALKIKAARIGVRRIDMGAEGGRIQFDTEPCVDAAAIIRLIQTQTDDYRLDGREKLRIRKSLPDVEARFAELDSLLTQLKLEDAA